MDAIGDASERFARLVLQAHGNDVHDALRALAQLRADVRRLEDVVTARAVDEGLSYASIGRALGMTRQSVRVKHLGRLAHGDPNPAVARADRLAKQIAEWEERQAALLEWAKRTPGQAPT
jgi:hypothetical protein